MQPRSWPTKPVTVTHCARFVANMGAQAVIPCNRIRKKLIPYDFEICKARNLIERCLDKLKHFRAVATRYDRRAIHFPAFIQLASAMLWMK